MEIEELQKEVTEFRDPGNWEYSEGNRSEIETKVSWQEEFWIECGEVKQEFKSRRMKWG
jgi:hypothetical protein